MSAEIIFIPTETVYDVRRAHNAWQDGGREGLRELGVNRTTLGYKPVDNRRFGKTNDEFAEQRLNRIEHLRQWVNTQDTFMVEDVEVWMNDNDYNIAHSTIQRDILTFTKEGWVTATRILNGANTYQVVK